MATPAWVQFEKTVRALDPGHRRTIADAIWTMEEAIAQNPEASASPDGWHDLMRSLVMVLLSAEEEERDELRDLDLL